MKQRSRNLSGSARLYSAALAVLLASCGVEHDPAGAAGSSDVSVASVALSSPPELFGCTSATSPGRQYWFCGITRSWTSARQKCQAVGLDLVAIGNATENQFVASRLLISSWIGANDVATEGTWRWADTNTQFWQGSAAGRAVGGAYANWQLLEPNNLFNSDCGTTSALGRWTDESCTSSRPYVCEGVHDECPSDPAKLVPGQCGCGIADTDGDADGTADCVDSCASDPGKTAAGQCGCGLPDTDSDGDGVANCVDGCASDPAKTSPGICGCGTADGDADGDGVINCQDECPNDSTRVTVGDCGCSTAPAAAGAPCDDGLCAANSQCNGAGRCGSPSRCDRPDSLCSFAQQADVTYWFCSNDRSYEDARSRCQARGMDLTVIESATEDDFITAHAWEHSLIGGSDQATEGEWAWLGTRRRFWNGNQIGTAVAGVYTNWSSGEPSDELSSKDCAVKSLLSGGRWKAHPCSFHDAYVCERIDHCPFDRNKVEEGICGCGEPDIDTDSDGTVDCNDECPYDSAITAAGPGGCPLPTCNGTSADLTPSLNCVLSRADGSKAAVFNVRNASSCIVDIAAGAQNQLAPGEAYRGQPTRFEPGHSRSFVVPIGAAPITWTLAGKSATASAAGPACHNVQESFDAPVNLTATRNSASGTSTTANGSTASLITFQVPARLPVTLGNAGNASALLTYRDASGTLVSCSYVGGSSTSEPDTDLDRARGRFFVLQSCSNGKAGGETDLGNQWSLQVNGGDPRLPSTQVELPIGRGCSGRLESYISPEETVQLRQAFDWLTTAAIPETDPTGLPALRYALIYLETREQYDALKRMKVYFRQRPLFASQLERYRDQCGVFDNAGDMHGVFVHALIPAALYNYLRGLAVQVIDGGQGEIPLRAIVLRDVPDEGLYNSDGSVSWQALRQSGFRYINDDSVQQGGWGFLDDVFEVVGEVLIAGPAGPLLVQVGELVFDTDIRVTPKLDDIAEVGADIVEGAWQVVSDVLGELQALLFGSSRLKGQLTILNRDSAFDTNGPMQKAWGPNWGTALVPRGAEAEFVSWGVVPLPPFALPYSDADDIDANGHFQVDVADNSIAGAHAPGMGLCIHMETDAAMISDGITENEFCDFGNTIDATGRFGFGGGDLPHRDDPSDPEWHEIRVSHPEFNYLTQLTDAHAYTKAVIGREPKQAEISVGIVANTFGGFNGGRPFAGCFDYTEIGGSISVVLAAATAAEPLSPTSAVGASPLGLFAYPFVVKDIFFPSAGEARLSRGVATHEYGHYLMCDMFHEQSDVLLDLYLARLDEGWDEQPEDQTAMSMESFADLFASQVVSGTNYFATDNSKPALSVDHCVESSCIEFNYRGLNEAPATDDAYRDGIRRLTSAYHDAFDRRADTWRTSNTPTNADAWKKIIVDPSTTPPTEIIVPRAAGEPGYLIDADDYDNIALDGPRIEQWIDFVAEGAVTGTAMLESLASTMYSAGATWCDVCPVFAQHDPGFNSMSAPLHAVWEACLGGELATIVGPAPDASLRLAADSCELCPVHSISDSQGQCVACASNRQIARDNACFTCADGTIPTSLETCIACAATSISVGNTCVPCGPGRTRDDATNTCVDCVPDAVIDAASFDDFQCGETFVDIANATSPGDNCADEFTLELHNAQALYSTFDSAFRIDARAFDALDTVACPASTLTLAENETEFGSMPAPTRVQQFFAPGQNCVVPSLCASTCLYATTIESLSATYAQANGITRMRYGFRAPSSGPPVSIFAWATDVCVGPD